jgi:hypothetical protein
MSTTSVITGCVFGVMAIASFAAVAITIDKERKP